MKKILIFSLLLLGFYSCTEDGLTSLNEDIKNPVAVEAGTLFANATVELFDWMTSTNVNQNNFRLWAQSWAQTTYADESNYILNERNVNGGTWNKLYATVIRDLREAKTIIAADVNLTDAGRKGQTAMADVLEIYAFHVLVDIFGDIPYSEALSDDVTPAYDDDAAIYDDLLTRLDASVANLSGSTWGDYDLIYGGNGDSWKKMANSLMLKLAIRIADTDDARAKTLVETAIASGVMTSSADNFTLVYENSTPNTNPLWEALVQSGRSDFVAANTTTEVMNALNDPRRSTYFSDLDPAGNALGGAYGDNNSYSAFSHPGDMLKDPTLPASLVDYSEVSFLLADAAARGYNVGSTEKDYYNNGVTASIEAWGGTSADAVTYLAQADVDYDTAPGTWREKIALQKWLALYNRGFEGWSTYRVYDAPTMKVAVQAGTTPPTRFTYPVTEYSLNGVNVNAANDAIGGDDLFTKVFWDAN